MAINLFGFEIRSKNEKERDQSPKSFVEPNEGDGSIQVTASVPGTGGTVSSILDIDGAARSEAELVNRYRSMMQQPEVQQAVDDIVNECVIITDDDKPIELNTDDIIFSDDIKQKIRDEFQNILTLMDFSNRGYDIFEKWYVDGRLYYHAVIDPENSKRGIQELRYIDPRKIRKIREYEKAPIGKGNNVSQVRQLKNEYYLYLDNGFYSDKNTKTGFDGNFVGLKIAPDSILTTNSGLMNEGNTLILSYLHSAYKALNQLRMMEDASVIYRLSRAPERRVFYIDVGNLPKIKAEQYVRDMMNKHKNRLVYDAKTGDITDDRKFMSMTDDFWMPRREGGRGTEISTLQGGQNLGEMDDVLYYQKNLYRSLRVPISRLDPEQGNFTLGRSSEITRDEVKFNKFVKRLRTKFAVIFDHALKQQLILKGIISPEDWESIKNNLRYDWKRDNHFEELKQIEILQNRISVVRDIDEYVGKYYSKDWVQKNVLQQTEDQIADIEDQIQIERAEESEKDGSGEVDY